MPSSCIVRGCSTTYKTESKSLFRFPKDKKLTKIWVNAIQHVESYKPSSAVICSDHFTYDMLKFDMKRKRLRKNAVPCLNLTLKEKESTTFKKIFIENFAEFKENMKIELDLRTFDLKSYENEVILYKVVKDKLSCMSIQASIKIDKELRVEVYYNGVIQSMRGIIPKRISSWNEVQIVIDKYAEDPWRGFDKFTYDAIQNLNTALTLIDEKADEFKYKNNLELIIDQLTQITSKKKMYSSNTIANSLLIYLRSRILYDIIRDSNILILPHASRLQKILASLNVNIETDKLSLDYLKTILAKLDEIEESN